MTSCTRALSGALGFGTTPVEGQSTFPVQLHPGSQFPLFLQSWPSSVGKEEGKCYQRSGASGATPWLGVAGTATALLCPAFSLTGR